MSGGEISNNTASSYGRGGGVYVTGGTFTMSGGEISNNTAAIYGGGGVYVNSGTFTMSGGEISGNYARDDRFIGYGGGGVWVDSGKFTMSGDATISDNIGSYGGGVFVSSGTFTMSGGTISGNSAFCSGTDEYVSGGGVYVNSGTFTMSGDATIFGNTAKNGGGAFYYGGSFTMSGDATIFGNTAKNGTGVYLKANRYTMNGSAAVTADNDVYLFSGKKITVNGAMSGGGAQNITPAVTTTGTIVVSVDYSGGTAKSVKQYFKLNSSLASEQRIGLTAEGNDLKIGALVPEVDDPTVFVTPYTSTVANVSFNLTTASGATKVYVNLTPVSGGTPIATQYTGTISPGMGVVNHQIPGLTAGTAYTLNITPWNDTTEGTLFTTTYTAPETYTVTIQNDGHGTGSASPAGGAAGTTITLTSSPASGYQFKAWQVVQGSVSVSGSTFPMPAENVILKALFEPQTTPTPTPTPAPTSSGSGDGNMNNAYRILFETFGGSFISPVTGLSSGDKIPAPPAPTKKGYTFDGWYTDEPCTKGWSFATGIPGDLTLYAKWIPLSATPTPTPTPTVTIPPTATPTVTITATAATPTVGETGRQPTIHQQNDPQQNDPSQSDQPSAVSPAEFFKQHTAEIIIAAIALLAILAAVFLRRKTITFLVSRPEGMRYYKVHVRKNHTIDLGKLPDELRRQTWYCDEDRTERWDFSEDTVVESITLYSGGYR